MPGCAQAPTLISIEVGGVAIDFDGLFELALEEIFLSMHDLGVL